MTSPSSPINWLGAEMLTWSDVSSRSGPFRGALGAELARPLAGAERRILIVGPTSVDLVLDIAAGAGHVDVLVRSSPDAEALRESLPPEIGVFCGPLDRMAVTDRRYDAVIALAGIDRLHSAEAVQPAPSKVLDDLVRLVSDRGELLVALGNPVGVDRLLSADGRTGEEDEDWPTGHQPVPGPPTVSAATDHLAAGHGLRVRQAWSCHGPRSAPGLAAAAALWEDLADDEAVADLLEQAYRSASMRAPVKDPSPVVGDLLRSGAAVTTASLTVLRVGRLPVLPAEPDLILADPPAEGATGRPVVQRWRRSAAGWQRSVVGDQEPFAVTAGLRREPARLSGARPAGRNLTELMAEACARHDAAAIGELVRAYRDFLAPGTPDLVAARPGLVLVDATGMTLADPSWVATPIATPDVILVRGLLDVAAELLSRGVRHPWSVASTPRTLADSLAAAAGITPDDALHSAAVELDEALRPAPAREFASAATVLPTTYVELAERSASLARRAADGDAHVLWLLHRLQLRDRAYRAVLAEVEELRSSREYRLGGRLLGLRGRLRSRIGRWRRRGVPTEEFDETRWRDPAKAPPQPGKGPIEIESHLVPPGYEPIPEVTILPSDS